MPEEKQKEKDYRIVLSLFDGKQEIFQYIQPKVTYSRDCRLKKLSEYDNDNVCEKQQLIIMDKQIKKELRSVWWWLVMIWILTWVTLCLSFYCFVKLM